MSNAVCYSFLASYACRRFRFIDENIIIGKQSTGFKGTLMRGCALNETLI
jgi:hypothetical protein